MRPTRRTFMQAGAASTASAALGRPAGGATAAPDGALPLRMILELLHHPYWYAKDGPEPNAGAAAELWDRAEWERRFARHAAAGYNAVFYFVEPWLVHQWQTFFIRHKEFPEARELDAERQEAVIRQLTWLFAAAKRHGLMSFVQHMCVVTTPSFARAHGMAKDLPVSETVDWRHNLAHQHYPKMYHWGVRNRLTRDFTEASIAELFQTYRDLDGLLCELGEALPGRRSTWFKEAIVPGLRRSGRKPRVLLFHWMLPLDDFLADVAPREVYDNTWLAIEHNGEIISDTEPDPISVRWAKRSGLPTVVQYVAHNVSVLPCNSPRLAAAMVHEARHIDRCRGLAYYLSGNMLESPHHELFGKALAYYGRHDELYSDRPWVDLLERRFGDRTAAQHFVNAYNASGEITPAVNQIAWCPHDGRCPNQLILRYWHWTNEDPRFSRFAAPAQGATLLPVRYYAECVARFGDAFRDNDGSELARFRQPGVSRAGLEHPGEQELIWGHIDYQVTPEAHMRRVRSLGRQARAEAEAGLRTARNNRELARQTADFMTAYDLLSAYYEHKVLTAVAALVYHFGGRPEERARAERLADETVRLYAAAATFLYETIDRKSGNMKGGWWDGQRDLPGLIAAERAERKELPRLFGWPKAGKGGAAERARLGTTLPDK